LEVFVFIHPRDNALISTDLTGPGRAACESKELLRQQLIGSLAAAIAIAAIACLAVFREPYGEAIDIVAQKFVALQTADLVQGQASRQDLPSVFRRLVP
jgi:hypothetical protein